VTVSTPAGVQAVIPDVGTRLRRIEGILRSQPSANGDITDPDKRIDQIENRINLLEQWANRVGTNSPPTTVSVTTYTVETITQNGDPA